MGVDRLQHAFQYFEGCGRCLAFAAIHLVDVAWRDPRRPRQIRLARTPTPTLSRNRASPHGPRATPRSRGCKDARAHPSTKASSGIPLRPRYPAMLFAVPVGRMVMGMFRPATARATLRNSAVPAGNDEEIGIVVERRLPERLRLVIRRRGDPRAQSGR